MDLRALVYVLFVFFHLPVQLWQWSQMTFLHFVFCICSITLFISKPFCSVPFFTLSGLHTLDLSSVYHSVCSSIYYHVQYPSKSILHVCWGCYKCLFAIFATDLPHALNLLLKLILYFCFLKATIMPSNKHIFVASTIWLHLAPRSFSRCPPSSYLSVVSHSKCMINDPSEKNNLPTLLFCINWWFPMHILSFYVLLLQDVQIAVMSLQISDTLSSCHNSRSSSLMCLLLYQLHACFPTLYPAFV